MCPFYNDLAAVLKTSERAVLAEIHPTQNTNINEPVIIIEESTESVGGLPKPPKIAAKTTKRSSLNILEDFVAVKKEGKQIIKIKI